MKKYIFLLITLIAALDLDGQCTDHGNYWNQSWTSCTLSDNPNPERGQTHWILYEFHEQQYIDSTWIWNANREGESGLGVREVIFDYSLDGNTWIKLGQYEFPMADESPEYSGFQGPNFEGEALKYILITVLSTHLEGDCASIAEVQFNIDDSACYGIVDACGICDGPGELTWYFDADNDGLGDINNSVMDCDQPPGYVSDNTDICDNGALGWEDIAPLFSDNGCNGCHNATAAGGLDLRSYETTMMGGNTCGPNLLTADHFVQSIVVAGYDACGTALTLPSMNARASGEFDEEELAQLQFWINGGAPEICSDFNFNVDFDQDGFFADEDCDDMNADINPDAEEIPNNGIDEDCDGADLITSTHEISNAHVSFHPNPASDFLNIVVEGSLKYDVRLYDVAGKFVLQRSNIETLDVSTLKSGIYLIELEDLESKQKVVDQIVIID